MAGPLDGKPAGQFSGLGFLLLGIVFVTLNLRGAITGVGPLLETIQGELGLSSGMAGLLATLPLFAFAFVSPFAASIARWIGMERTLLLALLVLIAGLVLRYVAGIAFLFGGTVLIGTGIALANVLVPGLIRRDFPDRLTFVTAIFTMAIIVCGGVGSAVAVPLAGWGGWRLSLVAWVIPAVIAILVWLPQTRHATPPLRRGGLHVGGLWRSALAWQVSLFMGLQSAAFYVLTSWLPAMLADQGISAAEAGWYLAVYQVFILIGAIVVPAIVRRAADQALISAGISAFILVGFIGLTLDPARALLWVSLNGIGCGGSLVLALSFFGLRARTAQETVALSGMAQAVGYLLAAFAPIALGISHDLSGGWTAALVLMVALSALQVACGYLAGRPLFI